MEYHPVPFDPDAPSAAPEAVWQVGQHWIKAYVYYHHPVLASPATDNDGQLYLPGMVAVTANRLRHRMDPATRGPVHRLRGRPHRRAVR